MRGCTSSADTRIAVRSTSMAKFVSECRRLRCRTGASVCSSITRGTSREEFVNNQGGVDSPLLANLYLHWFDALFHGPQGPAQRADAKLVRYADDFVVMAKRMESETIE